MGVKGVGPIKHIAPLLYSLFGDEDHKKKKKSVYVVCWTHSQFFLSFFESISALLFSVIYPLIPHLSPFSFLHCFVTTIALLLSYLVQQSQSYPHNQIMPALIASPALPPEQEETKDRSSIKLMDLPMTKKKSPVQEDTTATGAGGATSSSTASTVSSNTKQAASKQQQPSKSLPTIQASQKTTSPSSSSSELTFTEDSSISEDQDQQDPDQDQDDQTPRHRVGNPPHYETREERQIRIRRQFNQLDGKRSGYVDANSLVGFFAEVTSDVNVQKRYADELLQLCHTRKLHRNSVDNNGNNNNKDVSSSSGTEASLSGAGSADQEELNPKRHSGLLHYADFQVFVEEKEERLWNLFREIDHNNDNGKGSKPKPKQPQPTLNEAEGRKDQRLSLFFIRETLFLKDFFLNPTDCLFWGGRGESF